MDEFGKGTPFTIILGYMHTTCMHSSCLLLDPFAIPDELGLCIQLVSPECKFHNITSCQENAYLVIEIQPLLLGKASEKNILILRTSLTM